MVVLAALVKPQFAVLVVVLFAVRKWKLGGVTVAAAKKLIERGVIPRDESIVICITGNGLKTPDSLQDRLEAHVKIKPSLSAFDRALADLKSQTS